MQEGNTHAGALPPPPLKPPDGGGGVRPPRISFRDKLLGAQEPLPRREKVDLSAKNLFKIELEGGDRLKPKCYIAESILEELWTPWKDAVIVTLLGKTLGYLTMKDRLRATWTLSGGMDMIDIGSGYFLVKFDRAADREKVICEGPWMIFDHYVAVRPWTPDFIASEVKIKTTRVL